MANKHIEKKNELHVVWNGISQSASAFCEINWIIFIFLVAFDGSKSFSDLHSVEEKQCVYDVCV